jgi:DNA-binding transcriptional regulator LsrR (DeoR family)
MSIEATQLRSIPRVIAVVSGADRAAALAAAIRGRLIRGLVIDESAAHALLNQELARS